MEGRNAKFLLRESIIADAKFPRESPVAKNWIVAQGSDLKRMPVVAGKWMPIGLQSVILSPTVSGTENRT